MHEETARPAGTPLPRPAPRYGVAPDGALDRVRRFTDELVARRTIREFDSRPIPDGVLREAVRAAASAPSGANIQPWRFVVVTDPATKRALRRAAEDEERQFYTRWAGTEWLAALAPLGTDWRKPFLETAPAVIVVFEVHKGPDAPRPYYIKESVGIAVGFLLAALHRAGLATLTHTPSPMRFLNQILDRPRHERGFLLVPVGYPAADATVPDVARKPRRTGEAGPVTAALRRKDPSTDVIAVILRRVLLTGSDPPEAALTALAEIIRPMPIDTSIPMRLLAAHLRLRMGDPAEATRLVPVGLTHPLAHDHAVRIAIELRDPALAPVLRNHLAGSLTPFTARALLDFGVDRADLTEPMLRWLTGCDEHDPIVQACTDLLDPMALPGLRALADTDNRVRVGREHSSVIWHDERHRHAVLTGIAAIEARA
jgi:nitroreductase